MENTNEIMETIDETKEAVVEATEAAETSVGKVIGYTILGGVVAAGVVYAGYKGITGFLAKRKAKTTEEPVDVDYEEEDVEDSEE